MWLRRHQMDINFCRYFKLVFSPLFLHLVGLGKLNIYFHRKMLHFRRTFLFKFGCLLRSFVSVLLIMIGMEVYVTQTGVFNWTISYIECWKVDISCLQMKLHNFCVFIQHKHWHFLWLFTKKFCRCKNVSCFSLVS